MIYKLFKYFFAVLQEDFPHLCMFSARTNIDVGTKSLSNMFSACTNVDVGTNHSRQSDYDSDIDVGANDCPTSEHWHNL